MRRILITVPDLGEPGGVANYYTALQLDAEADIEYLTVTGGSRRTFGRALRLGSVYVRLLSRLRNRHTVLVNPSMMPNAFWRDGLIVLLANGLGTRVLVFWRGWDWTFFDRVRSSLLHRAFFRQSFAKAEEVIFLARQFADAAEEITPKGMQNVHFETTVADDHYLGRLASRPLGKGVNLLFMSRMHRDKGVYVVLEVFRELKSRYPHLSLTMAGAGEELAGAQEYVAKAELEDVAFPGFLRGRAKHRALEAADVFVFPTTYGEGMPNCVLEALAYGLPVVSRWNAGIPDVVVDGKNGFLTEGTEPKSFIPLVEKLVVDEPLRLKMGQAAREGSERFTRTTVRARMLALLRRD